MSSYSPEQQAAAELILKLRRAQSSFLGFIQLRHPTWVLPDFQLKIIDTLDKLERRTLRNTPKGPITRNLMMTLPPRHAKSTFGSIEFPAYFELRKPSRHTMSTSYNATLAADFGRQVRDIFTDAKVRQAFPDAVIEPTARASDVWRTTSGGNYYGIGLNGTTTGRPANFLNIDDPIKSREEAESATIRNKVWDFYTSSLDSRTQPEEEHVEGDDSTLPIRCVTLTRWHPDDIAGRIMASKEWRDGLWYHLNFQAITNHEGFDVARTTLDPDDPDYFAGPMSSITRNARYVKRGKDTALWDARFPLDELRRREQLNPRDFASLYQQKPYIEGGNLIKLDWWRYYPEDLKPSNFQAIIITGDTAFSKEATADFSVFCVMGLTQDGDIYLLDVIRGKWDFPELKQRLIGINNQWRGRGLRACYVEDRASGQSLIQEMRRESGVAIIPYKVSRDKVSRVNSITPIIEGGRVFLPKTAEWLDEFIAETVAFPSSTNDDQIDAFTMGVDILSRQSITPETLFGSLDGGNSLNQSLTQRPNNFQSNLNIKSDFKRWGE